MDSFPKKKGMDWLLGEVTVGKKIFQLPLYQEGIFLLDGFFAENNCVFW